MGVEGREIRFSFLSLQGSGPLSTPASAVRARPERHRPVTRYVPRRSTDCELSLHCRGWRAGGSGRSAVEVKAVGASPFGVGTIPGKEGAVSGSRSTAGALSITRIDFHFPLRNRKKKQTAIAMM